MIAGDFAGMEYYDEDSRSDEEPEIYENKAQLSDDLRFLASMPELCDVTFLVGETREPVCAVKAVLGARSRVFQKILCPPPPKEPVKEKQQDAAMKAASKLKAFIKRSSEPLLNMQPQQKHAANFSSNLSTIQEPAPDHQRTHQTLIIEEFEPDVFRQLIEYIHTGCVTLQPRTLLGVMNAADYYGLEELKRACSGFIQCCVTVDTVCALLATAERYIQYKCTKTLVQKVLEFVDEHGNEVLNLGSFALLPQHVVRLILARKEMKADEFSKFQAVLMWTKKYCDSTNSDLHEVFSTYLPYINFHLIPSELIMNEITPLNLVSQSVLLRATACQAAPANCREAECIMRRAEEEGGRVMVSELRSSSPSSVNNKSHSSHPPRIVGGRSMSIQSTGSYSGGAGMTTTTGVLPPTMINTPTITGIGGGGGSNSNLSSSSSNTNLAPVTEVEPGCAEEEAPAPAPAPAPTATKVDVLVTQAPSPSKQSSE